MTQRTRIQRFVAAAVATLALSATSIFAEERSGKGTKSAPVPATAEVTVEAPTPATADVYYRGNEDIEGVVLSVEPDGDSFTIRNSQGRFWIDAGVGVRVYYRGERFRVRDLERGDRVSVDLRDSSSRRLRARAVEVLWSVSHDGRRGGGRGYGHNDRRSDVLRGEVLSIDSRRDEMIVYVADVRREIVVDTSLLDRRYGSSWDRSIRRGDSIELRGEFTGWTFRAESYSVRDDRR